MSAPDPAFSKAVLDYYQNHMTVAQRDQFNAALRDAVAVIRRICTWMAEHGDFTTDPDG